MIMEAVPTELARTTNDRCRVKRTREMALWSIDDILGIATTQALAE